MLGNMEQGRAAVRNSPQRPSLPALPGLGGPLVGSTQATALKGSVAYERMRTYQLRKLKSASTAQPRASCTGAHVPGNNMVVTQWGIGRYS